MLPEEGGASPAVSVTPAPPSPRPRARRRSQKPLRGGSGVSGGPAGGRAGLCGAEVGGCGSSRAVLLAGPGRAGGRRGAGLGRPPGPGRTGCRGAFGGLGGARGARGGWGAGPGGRWGLGPVRGAAGPGRGQRRGPEGDAHQLHGASEGHRAVPGGPRRRPRRLGASPAGGGVARWRNRVSPASTLLTDIWGLQLLRLRPALPGPWLHLLAELGGSGVWPDVAGAEVLLSRPPHPKVITSRPQADPLLLQTENGVLLPSLQSALPFLDLHGTPDRKSVV